MDMQRVMLLQTFSGAIYMLIITVVAIRLLMLARRNRGLPEFLLGLSLLLGGTFGASMEAGGMAVMASVEDLTVVGKLLLAGKLFGLVALVCQGLFIWKVFRPEARWAPAMVGLMFACSGTALLGFWLHGTFTTAQIPMSWFWLELIGRTMGSVWLVSEAVRYYRLMRKRMHLGLADPVVCNRFLLWAVAGSCGVAMMLTAVPPLLFPLSTHPLMAWDIVMFSTAGIGFCIAYSLVFFPPASYLRWVGQRAAGRAS
jgi:hypothetical protein